MPRPWRSRGTSSATANVCQTRNPHLDDSAVHDQLLQPRFGIESGLAPLPQLGLRERAGRPQQIEQLLVPADLSLGAETLQVGLDAGDHLGVQQLLQAVLGQQLGQQVGVQRECGRLLLGRGTSPS